MNRLSGLGIGALACVLAAADADAGSATCNRAAFRVLLDVGHTAQEPGAISARGLGEFEFNLALAQRIDAKLKEAGFARTQVLVRTGPNRAGLLQRVQAANTQRGDLLLSIHHDSVPQTFKEEWELDGDPFAYSDRFQGHSVFVSSNNAHYASSVAFAQLLGRGLKARGLEYARHYTEPFMGRFRRTLVDPVAGVYRYDQLIMLQGSQMPAVLLEAGSIVNRAEELAMRSPERQTLIAAAAAEAIEKFCANGGRVRSK
jgi:N-acetylmuramoyl-L-alanine amidase